MANERAKQLAAKQRAEAKALRAQKRNSDNPRDWGTLKQLREAYKATYQVDKQLPVVVFGPWLGVVVIGLVLGLIIGRATGNNFQWIWGLIFGILLGASLALFIFTRRIKASTYKRYADQAGSGEVALSMLDKKKYSYTAAVGFNRNQDVVHRVVGPNGLLLVGDGNPTRLRSLLATEAKRHQQVLYGVDVQTVQVGDAEGQIPLDKLARHIEKMPKVLDKTQIAEVQSRLKALDSVRSRLSLPKGPLPTSAKGSRKAIRGR